MIVHMNHHLPLCVNPETDQGVLGVLQRQSPIKAKASILHSKIDMHKLFLILRKFYKHPLSGPDQMHTKIFLVAFMDNAQMLLNLPVHNCVKNSAHFLNHQIT